MEKYFREKNGNITIEEAEVMRGPFLNFEGRPTKYNTAGGKHLFSICLHDSEMAQELAEEGWNVKLYLPRDPQDEPMHYLEAEVRWGNYPPMVAIVDENKRIIGRLTEETVGTLDHTWIRSIDVTLRPYNYDEGKIKAYANSLYILREDSGRSRLAEKYTYPGEDEGDDYVPF